MNIKLAFAIAAAILVLGIPLVSTSTAASLPSCWISIQAMPSTANLPGTAIPDPGTLAFSEILHVNYSADLVNNSFAVQYLNGSNWTTEFNFTGNSQQFTETYFQLNSGDSVIGTNYLRAAAGGCLSSPVSFQIAPDPSAPYYDALAYVLVVLLVGLFFLFGRRLGWKKFVFVAGAAYLAISPFTGQRYDVFFLISSGVRILQGVNPFDPGIPQAYPGPLKWAFPPLYALYNAFSFWVYQFITGAPLPTAASITWPGWSTALYQSFEAYVPATLPLLVFILKIPMVLSALITGNLLKKMTGSGLAAVAWIASPIVILVGAVWGTLDPIATVLAVAAVYAFEREKQYHAYLFASFGAAVKVWPVLLIPIMLIISTMRNGKGAATKPLVAVLPAFLLTLGIYSIYGSLLGNLLVFVYARGVPTFSGAFSVNGLTWQQVLFLLNSPAVSIFLFVGVPAYVLMLAWIAWRKDGDLVKWTVVSILIFYLTYNFVNPQYFYWILPFLILQRRKFASLIFTLLPMVYLFFTYDLFYFVSPTLLPDLYSFGASIAEELKVATFDQSFILVSLIAGVIPTLGYLGLLYSQLRGGPAKHPDSDDIMKKAN